MDDFSIKNLNKIQREKFYQSKYDYYRIFNMGLIMVSVISYVCFFFTDCEIFGRFAHETLFSRLFIIFPFTIFLILSKKTTNYRVMVLCSYLMIHIIIWCTDWSTYLLPDRQHAITGMVIMNLIFVCTGFCAPFKYSVVAHSLMIVDIAIANQFIHYDNMQMMYMFNIPCIFAICVIHYLMQKVYLEQYITKEKLQNLIAMDQLTEVYNRNKIKEISDPITREFTFSNDIAVSVLLMDIDYFKIVNDKYGHEAGDKVLVQLAKTLKGIVRATDFVIRWGGEEFLVVMPGCPVDHAVRVAENIRNKVEESENGVCKVTVSIGISNYKGGDYNMVIKEADEAMYQAKNSGRNRVVKYNKS